MKLRNALFAVNLPIFGAWVLSSFSPQTVLALFPGDKGVGLFARALCEPGPHHWYLWLQIAGWVNGVVLFGILLAHVVISFRPELGVDECITYEGRLLRLFGVPWVSIFLVGCVLVAVCIALTEMVTHGDSAQELEAYLPAWKSPGMWLESYRNVARKALGTAPASTSPPSGPAAEPAMRARHSKN